MFDGVVKWYRLDYWPLFEKGARAPPPNPIGWKNKISKKRTANVQMVRAVLVMWSSPGCNQMTFPSTRSTARINFEFTSQTWFAAHASSRLFSGRNNTRERRKSSLQVTWSHLFPWYMRQSWYINLEMMEKFLKGKAIYCSLYPVFPLFKAQLLLALWACVAKRSNIFCRTRPYL